MDKKEIDINTISKLNYPLSKRGVEISVKPAFLLKMTGFSKSPISKNFIGESNLVSVTIKLTVTNRLFFFNLCESSLESAKKFHSSFYPTPTSND